MRSLRITTSLGEVVREPDRAALAATIESADRAGPGAFAVLDGDTDGAAPFLQASRTAGAWCLEVWRVVPHGLDEHYRTFVPDAAAVTATFWSWATGSAYWQRLRWQLVETPLAAAG